MAELKLEAYAAAQRWTVPAAAGRWPELLRDYLEAVARRCAEAGPGVVGHIKALAVFPDGGYLRGSVVSPALPASVEAYLPADTPQLDLTLNVIVYGLDRPRLEHIATETAARLAAAWRGEVVTHTHTR